MGARLSALGTPAQVPTHRFRQSARARRLIGQLLSAETA